MGWPDDREMPSIESGDRASVESLTSRDDRCIDGAERQVPVRRLQLRDPKPIGRPDWLGQQVASRKIAEEANFGLGPDSCPEQVRDLRDDQDWDQDRPWMVQEKSAAADVLDIVSVVGRVERSDVSDQRPASSDLRISSIRWETSLRPLRPAAPNLRLPPSTRCVSMACRVSSDTVMPRRSASWRSLASRSSGILTVVLFRVCQHTPTDSSLTAVRANLGVRWRTQDPTRGRFSYSGELQRTTTNTRLAVKNR
jgi:hypothetical protein